MRNFLPTRELQFHLAKMEVLHRKVPTTDTSKEVCPKCWSRGHTMRSHQPFHMGDMVKLRNDPEAGNETEEEAFLRVVGTHCYAVLLSDGRVVDMEDVVFVRAYGTFEE